MANKNAQDALNVEDQLSKSEAFFDKNKKTILIAIAAVVLVIAGFFLYKAYVSGPREDKASTALAKGQEYFNNEMFDKALNGDGAGYAGFVKVADLITYLSNYEGMNEIVNEILSLDLKDSCNKDEINDYIFTIMDYNIKNEISRLQVELGSVTDNSRKLEIGNKIFELKKKEQERLYD